MDELIAIYQRWVQPFYTNFLHGNFRHRCLASEPSEEGNRLLASFKQATQEIDTSVVDRLFEQAEWRARLTASWFCGLRQWYQYRDLIGQALLESRVCWAGQGYCVALARFADHESAQYLCHYLDIYLPQLDKFYDQHWAVPALLWIDRQLSSHYSDPYVQPGGLWDRFSTAQFRAAGATSLDSRLRIFNETLSCAITFFTTTEQAR